MKTRFFKALIITAVLLSLVLSVSGCTKENTAAKISTQVQGQLDALYMGEAGEAYLEESGVTAEQIEKEYLDGIKTEAAFFCYYIGAIEKSEYYETLPESTRAKIEDVYVELYKQANYQVRDPEKTDDGNYSVEVIVHPIDTVDLAFEELNSQEYQPFIDLVSKYNTGEISEDNFFSKYAEVMADLVLEKIPESGYNDPEAVIVNVSVDEDEKFTIDPTDLITVDSHVISYSNLAYDTAE